MKHLKKFAERIDRYFATKAEYQYEKILANKPHLKLIVNDPSHLQGESENPENIPVTS